MITGEPGKRIIPLNQWHEYHEFPSIDGMRYRFFNRKELDLEEAFIKAGPYRNSRVLVKEEIFWSKIGN